MAVTAVPPFDRLRHGPAGDLGRVAFDVLLAAVCLASTLAINLSGSESVPANRDHDVLTVGLTVVAVGAIALRRRWPLAVLVVTLAALLGLVLVKGTVGAATIGSFVAAYTAAAHGSARTARSAVAVVAVALVLTWVLDPVDLSAEGAVLSSAAFAAALVLGTGTRDRRERSLADVRAAENLAALERERADVERDRARQSATEERARITRELHDVLGHAMSMMVVQAGAAGRMLDIQDTTRARAAVAEIEQAGRESMAEMRRLLGILRSGEEVAASPRAPAPTLADVGDLVVRVGDAGLPATLRVTGERGGVAAGVDLAAYRIVQEALTNCLKHAAASWAEVEVAYDAETVTVEVDDDGRGPVTGSGPAPGHGLVGMRERVAMYDGDLTVGARPGGGFRVRAVLPRGAAS
ncbi:MAG TPA: sensor histidine kinase [Nocardioides sp.]|nr:sensor histidine kinase [Nocardioides sp.]